jgi:hypothetical protein
MTPAMRISAAVLLVGVAIIAFYDPTARGPGGTLAAGIGAAAIVPLGYFRAVAGAAGLFIS